MQVFCFIGSCFKWRLLPRLSCLNPLPHWKLWKPSKILSITKPRASKLVKETLPSNRKKEYRKIINTRNGANPSKETIWNNQTNQKRYIMSCFLFLSKFSRSTPFKRHSNQHPLKPQTHQSLPCGPPLVRTEGAPKWPSGRYREQQEDEPSPIQECSCLLLPRRPPAMFKRFCHPQEDLA